ncbi:Tetratricopeptide repeat (TPR)-like superfamily protein [Euphorbia peplus]|nr:Tetratricopeptide repeat (TPR)-like superfamily protein [Euphorbia peplus]
MLSHSTTLHSTGIDPLRRSTAVNPPLSINIPLRKPQKFLPQAPKPIKFTPITTTKKNKCSNLDIIRLMDTLNHPIPLDLYSSFLKESALNSDSIQALQLHNRLINHKDLKFDSLIIIRLLYALVSCGQLDIARNLFDKMPMGKNTLSWVIIIIGYLGSSRPEEGINLFIQMLLYHDFRYVISKFPTLIVGIVEACLDLILGKQLHCLILKSGRADDFSLSLMGFYGKLGCGKDANFVLDDVLHHDADLDG